MTDRKTSSRADLDILARDLHDSTQHRGGHFIKITSINSRIVKALLKHIDALEDRVERLERQLAPAPPPSPGVGKAGNRAGKRVRFQL